MSRKGSLARSFLFASFAVFAAAGTASAAGNKQQHADVALSATSGHCRIVGAISHRCLNFHSDSTWPQGLADYHGSNGG